MRVKRVSPYVVGVAAGVAYTSSMLVYVALREGTDKPLFYIVMPIFALVPIAGGLLVVRLIVERINKSLGKGDRERTD